MLELIAFAMLSLTGFGLIDKGAPPLQTAGVQIAGGQDVAPTGTPAPTQTPMPPPEDQIATGRFLTALEVKPILSATKANWIAIREFNGQDLVYLTHLESWRCGLHGVFYGLNGAPPDTPWTMEPCYTDSPQPNAIKAEGRLPYFTQAPGSVQQVSIRVLYDDNTEETAEFSRQSALLP